MTIQFTDSFDRDVSSLRDLQMVARVRRAIASVQAAGSQSDVPSLERLTGAARHYRIRVGDYRLGVTIEGDVVTFVRCLPRDQIYRQFP